MTYSQEAFNSYIELNKPRKVKVANGAYIDGIGIGNVTIRVFTGRPGFETKEIALANVLHVLDIARNLILVPQLQSNHILTQTTESLNKNAIVLTKNRQRIASGT